MKIIEALKKSKDLLKKADDIKDKIKQHCADLDNEDPIYPDQKRQISEWLQAHCDIIKEILSLKYRIQKTNVTTDVTIEIGGTFVTKTIAEWIIRRKELARLEEQCWASLTERNLLEKYKQTTSSNIEKTVKRRLYFDPIERDKKREIYRSEPSLIDASLEIVNAVTDLV